MGTPERPSRGFTLLELLIVISIVAFILSALALTAAHFRRNAQIAGTRGAIMQLKIALGQYRAQYGNYPGMERGNFAPTWPTPYDPRGVDFELALLGDIPLSLPGDHMDAERRYALDAWRQRLRYRRQGERILIWSAGVDRIDQTGAQDELKPGVAGDDLSSD